MSGPARSSRISASGYHAGIDWDRQPLGRVPDNALARALGLNVGSVQSARVRRGIPRFDRSLVAVLGIADALGTVDDSVLARRFGVSPNTIAHARKRAGIPPLSGPRRDWDAVPLGKTWDREIAEALDCAPTSVADARRARGIPPYRERRVCGCGCTFTAYTRDHGGCSALCAQIAVNHRQEGRPAATAYVAQALAALRREIKNRRK